MMSENLEQSDNAMKSARYFSRMLRQLMLMSISAMTLLGGCTSNQPQTSKLESVSMFAVNHTPYNITEFYVNDKWGGNLSALGWGSGITCCTYLPKQWHEGQTAKVRWTHSQAINDIRGNPIGETVWYEYDAPVLPFQSLQDIVVHFFPDGTAKIVVLSPENVANPQIADPVRPKGWDYPDANDEYCSVVKLNNISKKQCVALLKEKFGY